ncbi:MULTISPECIES: helix-turn-helix domain-containing protein [Halorubrum]|uniref:Helix-turn-helix transcriptional regulator n=1 Tax=Halorubrum ruber TaxID=2982524 RepID=A0A8T8LJB6_9EURY|nr:MULTISPECIES: helix-turn-helix domain-containing protein [Halorubrum]QUO47173.1 helix-turn-helix transcriptional regulator [Halorubrum ruber]
MSDAGSKREESQFVGRLLDALSEETNRTILSALDEPTSVADLVERCDIPMSTVYRRLDTLRELDLVTEHVSIDAEKGRYRRYERNVSRVSVTVDESGRLRARVERPNGEPDEAVTGGPPGR